MKSLQLKLVESDHIITEIEAYFDIQSRYFKEQDQALLKPLRNQASKVKSLIAKYRSS